MWPDSKPDLVSRLSECLREALSEVDQIAPDTLLSENEDVLVAALMEKHMPVPIEVDWDGVTRSKTSEVTTQIRDQFERGKIYTVPASKVTLRFPFTGSGWMLDYRTSTYRVGEVQDWSADRQSIAFDIVDRELNADSVRSRIASLQETVDRRVDRANTDLHGFRPGADAEIRARIDQRKKRILNDRQVEESLGIPVHSTSTPRLPVPAQRKQISLERRTGGAAKFAPEPELLEADYQDILSQVQGWARSMERSPGAAAKLNEEELRDLLLATLNGFWQGAAGGELFNGAGKTDVLVRARDRNVFIGELKIWRGPQTVGKTIDQLLTYLVWRDSKAAVVMFIRTADPTATIAKLHEAVIAHPRYVLTKGDGNPAEQVDYVFTADAEGRRISLAVIPVVLPR